MSGAGCAKAAEPPVALPGRAATVAVAPDNYGTLWLTTPGEHTAPQDGGHAGSRSRAHSAAATVAFGERPRLPCTGRAGARVGCLRRTCTLCPVPPAAGAADRRHLAVLPDPAVLRARPCGAPVGVGQRGPGVVAAARAGAARRRGRDAARRQDPTLPDTIYVAAGGRGLWKSTDYGRHASTASPGVAAATAVATTAHNDERVLVADARGLLRLDQRRRELQAGAARARHHGGRARHAQLRERVRDDRRRAGSCAPTTAASAGRR